VTNFGPIEVHYIAKTINPVIMNLSFHFQIDIATVQMMSDEQLSNYIPRYGDRVAAVNFCRRNENRRTPTGPVRGEKRKEKLLEKIRKKFSKNWTSNDSSSVDKQLKRGLPKKERAIELGWKNYDISKAKYVQVRTAKGGGTRSIQIPKSAKKAQILDHAKNLFFPKGEAPHGDITDFTIGLCDFKEAELDNDISVGDMYQSTNLKVLRFYLMSRLNSSDDDDDDIIRNTLEASDAPAALGRPPTPTDDELPDLNTGPPQQQLVAPFLQIENSIDEEVQFGPFDNINITLEDTISQVPFEIVADPDVVVDIIIKRGDCMGDMLKAFSNDAVLGHTVNVIRQSDNGNAEMARGDGVYRDCLAEFWQEFYAQCTLGTDYKVPYLRHDFGAGQWKSVARILLAGYRAFKYIPISLAPPFIEMAIYGSYYTDMLDTFMRYVDPVEKETLERAIVDFGSVDLNEIIEVFDSHHCRNIPGESNLTKLIEEIAHKEMIQTPMFVIDAWKPILVEMAFVQVDEIKDYTPP
jgi:hypothetical protein